MYYGRQKTALVTRRCCDEHNSKSNVLFRLHLSMPCFLKTSSQVEKLEPILALKSPSKMSLSGFGTEEMMLSRSPQN